MSTTGSFFHISDFHLNPLYVQNVTPATYCATTPGYQTYNYSDSFNLGYGQYGCDPPFGLIQAAVNEMKVINANPDFIVFTGDMAGHSMPPEVTLSAIDNVTQTIIQSFPKTPFIPTIGNNDLPQDYFLSVVPNAPWLKKLAEIWSPLFPSSTQKSSFTYGGYYSHDLAINGGSSLKVIALNTVLYSIKHDPNTTSITDPLGQFSWLSSQLSEARANHQKVYITGHIPPGSSPYKDEEFWFQPYVSQYFNITVPYSDVIEICLFGHLHRDDFRVVYNSSVEDGAFSIEVEGGVAVVFNEDDKPVPVSAMLLSPSLSPVSDTNPTIRLVFYDQSHLGVLDYYQYYADLFKAITKGSIEWSLEYSFDKSYGFSEISASTVSSLLENIIQDPRLFNEWIARRVSQFNSSRLKFYCSMAALNRDRFVECAELADKFTSFL
eukprot:TRINITY_DN10663_c0_g3_i2.p1 TRINITY_DN10663_c0_g3~~TRINITY_DN10663_c0_g3_i2.p1  ORF type:complete len:472 (+),score=143.08 TRINITY_DN10663_c0_g3_i2:110-1417(+)